MIDLINLISEDNSLIIYRPSLRSIGKSVTGTILLSQIIFRWNSNGRKPFYKFKEPCAHELYKEGDSWCEELGFSKKEFDSALKNIAIKKNAKNKDDQHDLPIEYFVKNDRTTWYNVNEGNLRKCLNGIYVNNQRGFTKSTKGDLLTYTENTTETTSEKGENEFSQYPQVEEDVEEKGKGQQSLSLQVVSPEKEKVPQKRKRNKHIEPKSCPFSQSKYFEFEDFEKEFIQEEELGIDVSAYYWKIHNWSSSNERKRSTWKSNWISTARNFMASDKEKGKLVMVKHESQESDEIERMKKYLARK